MTDLGAIVLCGGQSRRMGRPKAWLPFGNEVLLQRVVRLLQEEAKTIVVVAAPGQDLPRLPPSVVIARDPVESRGPLQGIAVGLDALKDSVAIAYATATDAPFLRPDWVRLMATLIGDHDLAMPQVDGFLHPLASVYRCRTVLPTANQLLAADRRRPIELLESLRGRIVTTAELRGVDPELSTLRNLNTPEEYEAALRELAIN